MREGVPLVCHSQATRLCVAELVYNKQYLAIDASLGQVDITPGMSGSRKTGETRSLLSVDICSVWLLDPATGELICRQATGSSADVVRDWRLAPNKGIAGWVASAGQSLIVPDIEADERHYGELNDRLNTKLHSSSVYRQRSVVRQARNEELDAFAHTVAHDLKKPADGGARLHQPGAGKLRRSALRQ